MITTKIMSIFDGIFGNKEELEYRKQLAEVYNPIADKVDEIKEDDIKELFKTILDASERALRVALFTASPPEELNFKKQITKDEIEFWLRKVSLALLAYSYYFYQDASEAKKDQDLARLVSKSYREYWDRIYDYYNQFFNDNIGQKEIDYYASGLKEDTEKGYAEAGDMGKVHELATRDNKTIGSELLKGIWKEDVKLNEKKGQILGFRIWQAYQQIVQPFLGKLLNT